MCTMTASSMFLKVRTTIWMLLLVFSVAVCHAFVPSGSSLVGTITLASNTPLTATCTAFLNTHLRMSSQTNENPKKSSKKSNNNSKKVFTIGDLRKELLENPAKFQPQQMERKSKYRRSRKRVENPKQRYLYKSQRVALEREGKLKTRKTSGDDNTDSSLDDNVGTIDPDRDPLAQAKEFGLMVGSQHCDPLVDGIEPRIVGQIRVGKEEGSGSYAYLIDKPAGWSILGGGAAGGGDTSSRSGSNVRSDNSNKSTTKKKADNRKHKQVAKVQNEDGSVDYLEFDERDVLALMTPEEIEEYYQTMADESGDDAMMSRPTFSSPKEPLSETKEASISIEWHNMYGCDENEEVDEKTSANLRRIATRVKQMKDGSASLASISRPSVVSWLKDLKSKEGTPIKGGNFWTALSGAAEVDDSGLVLLCPKINLANIFVEYCEYVAVMGTDGYLAPRSKIKKDSKLLTKESIQIDITSKLRKGREDDDVLTVKVTIPEIPSTCASVVDPCQMQLRQGIRGDPAANPFDRRAWRRLIHCDAISASSFVFDETVTAETTELPCDISILAERHITHQFTSGSYLGRSCLKDNMLTTAYREINGAADGYPGWTVDRYDKWLFIQHDRKMPEGPIPSIHDGNTAGVYYLESAQDRSAMGSENRIRPQLLEGQRAPESFVVLENGVKYKVSLDTDLSTGIFLDQRPQRAWLKQHCCESTHLLNCFAHTGAFSVAAAVGGASTVSLDLSQKWLDRFPEHLEVNKIPFDERHDCIYGDCFDWLARLARRGEKYDIIILDPPSSSIGSKKKRWSVKNDMDKLVSLAAPLVKNGGLLWTTTNSASIHPIKFARLCRKGLEAAGIESAKLERIQPMPHDFPSIGAQSVKNLVWRIP